MGRFLALFLLMASALFAFPADALAETGPPATPPAATVSTPAADAAKPPATPKPTAAQKAAAKKEETPKAEGGDGDDDGGGDDDDKAAAAEKARDAEAAEARAKTAAGYRLSPGRSIEVFVKDKAGAEQRQLITKNSELRTYLSSEDGANFVKSFEERDLIVAFDEDDD